MNEEKPTDARRSILVESDPVELIALQIDGEGLTRIARSYWDGGNYLRALSLLMDGCRGIQWEVAVKILEGKLALTGVSPEIKVRVDNDHGHATMFQAIEKESIAHSYAQIGENAVHPQVYAEQPRKKMELKELLGKVYEMDQKNKSTMNQIEAKAAIEAAGTKSILEDKLFMEKAKKNAQDAMLKAKQDELKNVGLDF